MIVVQYAQPPAPVQQFVSNAASIILGRQIDGLTGLDLAPDQQVSRQHACLSYEDGQYWIQDLHSKRGTWLNEQLIKTKTIVHPGDFIRIGQTILEVLTETSSLPPATGTISYTINADQFPFTIPDEENKKAVEQVQKQLKALYELSQAFGKTTNLDETLRLFIQEVQQVIPGAQHGAILLLDKQGKLLLKDHWPPGEHFISRTWSERAMQNQEAFLWTEGGEEIPTSLLNYQIRSAIYAPLLCNHQSLGVVYVDNHGIPDAFSTTDVELLSAVSHQLALYVKNSHLQQELQHEAAIRSNLLRQFSPKVAERLMQKHGLVWPGGERVKHVTILYADVRHFTALCANMQPDDVMRMLNEMFSAFVPIIFRYGGTIDKYIGDAILAIFGSPEPDNETQWEHAIKTAVEMQQAIKNLGDNWQKHHLPVFEIGIGIHSGEVLHGFVGSLDHMEYTVIGDTVNRAQRYCAGAGRGEIVISHIVYEYVYHLVISQPLKVRSKYPEVEPDLSAYLIKSLK